MIELLKIFVTVAEQQHFSRAAELLNISQPAVSQHIRNLENEFHTKLLHRSPKYVQLTQAGEILYSRAKQILALYDQATQDINELHNVVTGSLHVGASFTIGEYILPRILAKYAKHYPLIDIHVEIGNTTQVIEALQSKKLDVGLIEGNANPSDLRVDPFMEDDLVIVAPREHAYSEHPFIEEDMLQNQVWILRENGSGTRAYCDKLMHDLELKVKRSYVFSSSQSVKEAVKAGLGIAMLSRLIVDSELREGEIVQLKLKNRRFTRPFSIIQTTNTPVSKATSVFIEQIFADADCLGPVPR